MILSSDALDRLAPARDWVEDWDDVVRRAAEANHRVTRTINRRRLRVLTPRRIALAAAVAAAVIVPLVAVADNNDWWFFQGAYPGPAPLEAPVVVKQGEWDGHSWKLVSYRSSKGFCWSFVPTDLPDPASESALVCGPFAGVVEPQPNASEPAPKIDAMMISGDRFPAYIAGVVVPSADVVRVVFVDGQTRDFPTFEAPAAVGGVRFFAGQLGTASFNSWHPVPQKLVGLDASGNVVACHDKTKAASSTLADCR